MGLITVFSLGRESAKFPHILKSSHKQANDLFWKSMNIYICTYMFRQLLPTPQMWSDAMKIFLTDENFEACKHFQTLSKEIWFGDCGSVALKPVTHTWLSLQSIFYCNIHTFHFHMLLKLLLDHPAVCRPRILSRCKSSAVSHMLYLHICFHIAGLLS